MDRDPSPPGVREPRYDLDAKALTIVVMGASGMPSVVSTVFQKTFAIELYQSFMCLHVKEGVFK